MGWIPVGVLVRLDPNSVPIKYPYLDLGLILMVLSPEPTQIKYLFKNMFHKKSHLCI